MSINRRHRGGSLYLELPGDLDAAAVALLREEFEAVAREATGRVIVDLSATQFIDSSGIGVLVFLFKRLRAANKPMLLSGVHGQPHRMLEALRIYEYIPHVVEAGMQPARAVVATA